MYETTKTVFSAKHMRPLTLKNNAHKQDHDLDINNK